MVDNCCTFLAVLYIHTSSLILTLIALWSDGRSMSLCRRACGGTILQYGILLFSACAWSFCISGYYYCLSQSLAAIRKASLFTDACG